MRSASSPLLRAIGARLNAAYATAGVTCTWSVNPNPTKALPYGVLGSDTETDSFASKLTDGVSMTHTLRIYSRTSAEARRLADIAIANLTDRDSPISLTSDDDDTTFYMAGRVRLEMNEIVEDRDERGDIYGAAIRFRFTIGQY